MRFAIVELAENATETWSSDYKRLKRDVERMAPSRWFNPVLIAVPDDVTDDVLEDPDAFGGAFPKDSTMDRDVPYFGDYDHDTRDQDGRGFDYDFAEWVVAVPDMHWGYGNAYRDRVEANRKRLHLE